MLPVRAFWTRIHRYAGLATAAFLFLSGLTGAVISWDHELDDVLNPQLMQAHGAGRAQEPLALAAAIAARHPHLQLTYVPLHAERGRSLAFGVAPKSASAGGQLQQPGFNQLFVDPVSGAELGRREWGAVWPISRQTLVSFLYKLHYTLHLPAFWGSDRWGIWLMGGVALVWLFDCLVGLYLTMPARRPGALAPDRPSRAPAAANGSAGKSWWQRWQPAWRIRWRAGPAKRNFDLHRAFSLWTWGLLLVLAFTGFSLNLYTEVFYPLLKTVSTLTPSPFDSRPPAAAGQRQPARLDYRAIVGLAQAEAARRGWPAPAGGAFYASDYGVYGVSFFSAGDEHGDGGVGPPYLYYDGDGRLLGQRQPWQGTVADIFVQAQFPLHSGRILGLPGRILVSLMGLVVAMLSVTGVLVWWKKRRARRAVARQRRLLAA